MAKTKEKEEEEFVQLSPESARVINWRQDWLRSGGFSRRNAELLATTTEIDYRYANRVLADCKRQGYDEDFAMKLIL